MPETNTVIPLHQSEQPQFDEPRRFKVYTARQLDKIEQLSRLDDETRFAMEVVANVLPFRVNEYVINELINWDKVPNDPIYQLTFPQKGMLAPEHFDKVATAMRGGDKDEIKAVIAEVREALNPHPAGQMEHNMPEVDGEKIDGIQHKYNETVLFFPSQGQVPQLLHLLFPLGTIHWRQRSEDCRQGSRSAQALHPGPPGNH